MSDAISDGYRNLVHLLLVHGYRNDDDQCATSIEAAVADFKRWVGENVQTAALLEEMVAASQVYDCMRHP
jgi:hypothetical protein